MVADLGPNPSTRVRGGVGAGAEAVRAACYFHCGAHFGCPLGGEDAGVFGLGPVAPNGGLLFAHEGYIARRTGGGIGAGGSAAAGEVGGGVGRDPLEAA
jgi:hypothetical protein